MNKRKSRQAKVEGSGHGLRVLETLINHLPAMVFYKDLDGVYISANEAFCHQLGTTPLEIIGRTDYDFYPQDVAERYRATDLEVINSGSIPEGFEEEITVQGKVRVYHSRKLLLSDEIGKPYGIIGLAYDITRQKEMEGELRSMDQRHQAIIKALPDLMFVFDRNATFIDCYVSDPEDLLALPKTLIGMTVRDFFNEEISIMTFRAISACLDTDTLQSFEYTITKTGRVHFYEARFIKIDSEKVLCISRDVTNLILLQKDLTKAKERAEASSRLKSALLQNMHHELRTPLNGIIGFSGLLRNTAENPEHAEMAMHIYNSGIRLLKTFDSIVMLSQLESGTKEIRKDYFDVDQQIEMLVVRFGEQVKEKGLYLRKKEIGHLTGYLDHHFFLQALSHILENAVKFTLEGGIWIQATEWNRQNERHLLVTVEDTGIGIPKNHLKMIFEEFRQASEGSNRDFEGSGLGLTIAVKMIQLLGGKVDVRSKVGKGSRFRISVPFPAVSVD